MKPTVEQIQKMIPVAGMLRNPDASPESPSPVLDAAEVREVLMKEVARLRREMECWKVLASTEDGFWPLSVREAVRSLDLEACKTEAARGHEFVRSLQAARDAALAQVAVLREALRCVERACLDQQCAAKEYKLDVGLPYLQLALDFARSALASTPATAPSISDCAEPACVWVRDREDAPYLVTACAEHGITNDIEEALASTSEETTRG